MSETPKWHSGRRDKHDGAWFRNVQIGGEWMIEHYDGDGHYSYTEPPAYSYMSQDLINSLIDPTKTGAHPEVDFDELDQTDSQASQE